MKIVHKVHQNIEKGNLTE